MLKSWSVNNFKSFFGRTDINLAPITLLAGSNSSGKSSILQSILLIKQTLQYAPAQRPIGLNGPLLKLGRFDDIRNVDATTDSIGIGWTLDELSTYRSPELTEFSMFATSQDDDLEAVTLDLSFGISGRSSYEEADSEKPLKSSDLAQLQPILLALRSVVYFGDDDTPPATIEIKNETSRSSGLQGQVGPVQNLLKFRVIDLDDRTFTEVTRDRPDSSVIGAGVSHFIPDQVGYSFDQRAHFSNKVAEYLVNPGSYIRYSEPEVAEYTLPVAVITYLVRAALETLQSIDQPQFLPSGDAFLAMAQGRETLTAKEFVKAFENALRNSSRTRQLQRTWLLEHQEAIQHLIFENAQALSTRGVDTGSARSLYAVGGQIRAFFQFNIHYLGPLRDEPRPIYPLEALINPKDVGYRGEHTAAVLDLHRDTLVQYFQSSDAGQLVGANPTYVPLHAAVQDWLSYLGVAEAFATEDLGKWDTSFRSVSTKAVKLTTLPTLAWE